MTIALGSFALILLGLEFFLESRALKQARALEEESQVYYSWSYHTQSGVRFGDWRGLLKLQLAPGVIYRNMPSQQTEFFSINSRGFRGKELGEKSRKRVVLLGGSTAFGTGLDSDDETAASKMEELLGVEVVNAAVIGHRTGQEVVFLANELAELEPDLVVTLSGWNDFSQYWLSTMQHRPLGYTAFEMVDGQVEAAQRLIAAPLLERARALPRFLFPSLSGRLARLLDFRKNKPRRRLEGADWKIPLLAMAFVKNIEAEIALAQARGARFICLLQPVRVAEADQPHELLTHYTEFRRLVRARFSEASRCYVDLNEPEFQISNARFRDLTHLDSLGHDELARHIVNVIQDRALLA